VRVRCPVLVGRSAELAVFTGAFETLGRGQGRAVIVTGEPGVGKSRLVREVGAAAGATTVVVGRCVEGDHPSPLRPWAEATMSLTRAAPLPAREVLGPYAAVLGRLVPEWGALVGEPPTGPLLGEAVLRLLRAMAPQGCVVVLEDVHWADPETLAVLEYVCDHVVDEAVLLVVTLRDTDSGRAAALADALVARGSALPVPLGPLDAAGVSEMVRACGVDDDGTAAAAEGLPLLVEELLGERGVPRTFAGSVTGRVAQLGLGGRRALLAAAVLGRAFDWRLVVDVAGDRAVEALDDAVVAGLLAPDGDGYQFRHALTREAVLAIGSAPELGELAAGLAAALRVRSPELPGAAAVLAADLAARAGDPGAAELFGTAGRRAARDGALDSAAALLERGRLIARSTAQRAALADALADVHCRAGRLDAAVTATRDLDALLRAGAHDPAEPLRRRAHVRLARAFAEAARWEDAEVELTAVSEPANSTGRRSSSASPAPMPPAPPPAGPAAAPPEEVEADLVRALILLGNHATAEAAAMAMRVVEPALVAGLPDLACEALQVVGRAARGRDGGTAPAAFERARVVAVAHDLPLAELSALHELGTIDMFSTGRRDRLLAARRGAESAGAVRLTAVLDLQLVAAHHMHGDREPAEAAARRALDGATTLDIAPMRVIALALTTCPIALTADRKALEAAIAAIPTGALDGDPDSQSSIWGTSRATCSLLREDRASAVRELETAAALVEGATEIRPQTWWGFWVLLRAIEGRDAVSAIVRLRSCPAAGNRQNLAYAELAEAVLVGRAGDGARAAATVARWDASALPWAWLRQLGRRLVAEAALVDGWGEPTAWLSEAAAFFERFGAPAVSRECLRLAAGTPTLSADLRRRGVTPREGEIFALLGQGITGTRELAAHLVISPRTVEKHVEALCRKLDVRTRSQLAALAGQVQAMT
jgi:DNA-binding CsgD family transcriptional regulator